MSQPAEPFFARYTRLVTETDLVTTMREQGRELERLFRSIPASDADKLHGRYTWTPKQVVGHIIDAERVFGYRAMRFARADATPLPGFDENAYVAHAGSERRALASLAEEFAGLRQSHVAMFSAFPPDVWIRTGTASNITWAITDLAKAIIGHARHHETILRQRLGGAV